MASNPTPLLPARAAALALHNLTSPGLRVAWPHHRAALHNATPARTQRLHNYQPMTSTSGVATQCEVCWGLHDDPRHTFLPWSADE